MSCLCTRLSCHLTVSLLHATLGVRHGRLAHPGDSGTVHISEDWSLLHTLLKLKLSLSTHLLLPVLSYNRVDNLMDFDEAAALAISWLASAISVSPIWPISHLGYQRILSTKPQLQNCLQMFNHNAMQVQQLGWKRLCKCSNALK